MIPAGELYDVVCAYIDPILNSGHLCGGKSPKMDNAQVTTGQRNRKFVSAQELAPLMGVTRQTI